jgi:hypothetical protein
MDQIADAGATAVLLGFEVIDVIPDARAAGGVLPLDADELVTHGFHLIRPTTNPAQNVPHRIHSHRAVVTQFMVAPSSSSTQM